MITEQSLPSLIITFKASREAPYFVQAAGHYFKVLINNSLADEFPLNHGEIRRHYEIPARYIIIEILEGRGEAVRKAKKKIILNHAFPVEMECAYEINNLLQNSENFLNFITFDWLELFMDFCLPRIRLHIREIKRQSLFK